jgi:hypothetical protein
MEIETTVPEVIVTVADPDLVGSDSKVAVTATIGGLGALAGAVYNPLALMLPQADSLHPLPDMLQMTRALEVPLTLAVNCNCAPGFSWAEGGDTLTEAAATSVTTAEAEADGSAVAVAFTVTLGGVGRVAGAVYSPADVIVPQATPLHPDPETVQATAVFVLPVTVAENCNCPPEATCGLFGVTETETDDADCTINKAEPDFAGLATDTAVIVIAENGGTLLGAV